MGFPKEVQDKVMTKCGRRCCICRRFDPTMLQIHHIVEQSKGGPDTEENAIPMCITCHSEVHTKRPFTQRFTREELIQHRDSVYFLVAEGKLVEPARMEAAWDPIGLPSASEGCGLSEWASKILISAAEAQSAIVMFTTNYGLSLNAGQIELQVPHDQDRLRAEIQDAVDMLELNQYIHCPGYKREVWRVTHHGYLAADSIASSSVQIIYN